MLRNSLHKNYFVAILAIILAFNFVDRQALGLVLQDIKGDLSLSDTQVGLLTGTAFAVFYSIMGIPIARWADRGDRVLIISLTVALWSAAVALCALAGNFLQLLLIRIGVAVGEAGCIPPAHSLIADYFTRAERPRAVAVYMLGASFSVVIGYFLAGWLNQFYGWRVTFVLLGLPGLVLGPLAWFTLKEPRREKPRGAKEFTTSLIPNPETEAIEAQSSLKAVCATLWANITFRHLLFCFSVMSFFGAGIGQWQAAFLIRSYGLKTGELGTWDTVIYGLGSVVGTYLGGELASRHAARNERLQLKAMAIMFCSSAVISAFTYLSRNQYVAFGLMWLIAVGGATTNGPLFATIQSLVPQRARATSIALIYLFANLIGLGLGPLAAGALSDALRPLLGEESLRYALLALCPGYFWCAWHLWQASKTVSSDLESAQAPCDAVAPEESAAADSLVKRSLA